MNTFFFISTLSMGNSTPNNDEVSDKNKKLRIYATLFIVIFGIYYIPLEPNNAAMGIPKIAMMAIACVGVFSFAFSPSKAMLVGFVYLGWKLLLTFFFSETFRWTTLFFSVGLVFSYICLYNLICVYKVFSIDYFLKIIKRMMMAYFIFCIMQQACILVGVRYLPIINLILDLNRGLGCQSLFIEPSMFARFMLIFYYAYVKCNEYKRNKGPFTVKELFSGEYKWVTIRFLWMMLTMGSGTAFCCLILFIFYFIRKNNALFIIPILLLLYAGLNYLEFEQLSRATSVINAMTTLDQAQVKMADGSGAARISPLLNSFSADFTKFETWFGYGVDYARDNNLFVLQQGTLFDDYGLIFYLLGLIFSFTCAYRFFSLATLFMFAGVGGGVNGNIHYAWELMIIITCVRYFYENKNYSNSQEVQRA